MSDKEIGMLKAHVSHLQEDVSEVKSNIHSVRSSIASLIEANHETSTALREHIIVSKVTMDSLNDLVAVQSRKWYNAYFFDGLAKHPKITTLVCGTIIITTFLITQPFMSPEVQSKSLDLIQQIAPSQ